jgi:hypothetical protein
LLASLIVLSLIPSKQIHYLIPLLPAFALLVARLLTPMPQASLAIELVIPLAIELIGWVLLAMPYLPSKWHWMQSLQMQWGVTVSLVGILLIVFTLYKRRLSIPATTSAIVVSVSAGLIWFFQYTDPAYHLTAAAQKIREFQEQGVDYAFVGDYQGQFQFLGKLQRPLPVIDSQQSGEWRAAHPGGILISVEREPARQAMHQQLHREYWLIFRGAQD